MDSLEFQTSQSLTDANSIPIVNRPTAASQPPVSGLYTLKEQHLTTEFRLDVDGYYPQMAASGTRIPRMGARVHWIASELRQGNAPDTWFGYITQAYGATDSFRYNKIEIRVSRSSFPGQQTASVTFITQTNRGDIVGPTVTLPYTSPSFRTVTFEFDRDETADVVLEIDTHAHPNHPANLPRETLTVQEVFRRAGFDVKTTSDATTIPLEEAGRDKLWSDAEMHDAMLAHWSQAKDEPQWSLWTLFATASDQGPGLGGIMFDSQSFGRERQGTAIFTNSFISRAPTNDANPQAFIKRNIFWTAVHEMGHAFNLLHAWQKGIDTPWPFSCYDPKALSFMNYPHNYPGGQANFYADFELRFTPQEYLFLRHAPEPFVQMGNHNFGKCNSFGKCDVFEDARVSPSPSLRLELRVNRSTPSFRFLEAVVAEIKLTNITDEPQLVNETLLKDLHRMTVRLQRDGQDVREMRGFATYCYQPTNKVLMPGESLYHSIFLSVGANGWLIDSPGHYTAQVAIHLEHEDLVSNPLRLRVMPPSRDNRYDEEYLAQDFFSEDVGRILTFDGSRLLDKGNDTLREITERLPNTTIAKHAQIALALPLAHDYHYLDVEQTEAGRQLKFKVAKARPEEAKQHFQAALMTEQNESAATLGHIDYNEYTRKYSEMLAEQGEHKAAVQIQESLLTTLSERGVNHRVLRAITDRAESYQTMAKGTPVS